MRPLRKWGPLPKYVAFNSSARGYIVRLIEDGKVVEQLKKRIANPTPRQRTRGKACRLAHELARTHGLTPAEVRFDRNIEV